MFLYIAHHQNFGKISDSALTIRSFLNANPKTKALFYILLDLTNSLSQNMTKVNALMRWLQLRFDFDSTAVRRAFDCLSKVI